MSLATPASRAASPDRVNCMEVWGGNEAAGNGFSRPGLDVWVWSSPQENAIVSGGDVHFLSSCASGRITRMLIADVCAQGAVFAELATGLRQLMMQNVNRIKQTRFVEQMGDGLRGFACRGGFSTALVATYFSPTKSLALCNTGQPPPFLFRANQRAWSILKQAPMDLPDVDQIPPGVVDQAEYQQFDLRLDSGDMLLCYSNALTECRDASDQYLGVDGLLKRVAQIDHGRPAAIIGEVARCIQNEHPENLTQSDATMMLCRATNNGVGWKNNLLAPFRLLRSVSDKTRLR